MGGKVPAKDLTLFQTQWAEQYNHHQKRYPLEHLSGVVLLSELDPFPEDARVTVHFSGFAVSEAPGLWHFAPLQRLILRTAEGVVNFAHPQTMSLLYDQSDSEIDILTVMDGQGRRILQLDFSVYTQNRIKIQGGFLLASGFRAFEITPESLSQRDDLVEDYFKRHPSRDLAVHS